MKKFIIFILVIILVIALLGSIGYYVLTNSNTNFNFAVWKGYSSDTTFSKAIDADEFLGKLVDEYGFYALVEPGVLYQDDNKLSIDIVTVSNLIKKYGVSESLGRYCQFLSKISPIKGATSCAAIFMRESWYVLKWKTNNKIYVNDTENRLFGTGICQIHNSKMSAESVRIGYGYPSEELWAYHKISSILFPNCDDPVLGGCVVEVIRYAEKYICKDCNNDRDKWKKDNWEIWMWSKYATELGTSFLPAKK